MEIVKSRMLCHPPGVLSAMEVGQKDAIGEPDEAHMRSVAVVEFRSEDEPGIRALYDGTVRSFDDWLGKCRSRLEDLDLWDDTLVVLLSDHGEELLERGNVGHSSCNLMGTLYEECLRVPLVMRFPKRIPPGTVVRQVVSQTDVMPTIFELLGLDLSLQVDGQSLLPLVRGDQGVQWDEVAFAEVPPAGWQRLVSDRRLIRCLRTPEWKLIQNLDPGVQSVDFELYNLIRDPGERENVAGEEPVILEELKEKLEETVLTRSRSLGLPASLTQ
jgi:arylsulfatase A-like enzyme